MQFPRAGVMLAVVLASATASADPSERTDRSRLFHAIPPVAGGALYLTLEIAIKGRIIPDECRWCESNRFDTAVRSSLRWDRVQAANAISNITGYVGNPAYAMALLITSNRGDWRRTYDDLMPVVQAGVVTGVVNWIGKAIAVRRRPFALFKAEPVRAKHDYDTSFFSGHTSLAFTMAVSSATVARLRDYRSETALWIGGLTLATATGYLRIAGDAHYATDVITGALVGAAIGIAVPLFFHLDALTDEAPVPRRLSDEQPVMFSFGSAF